MLTRLQRGGILCSSRAKWLGNLLIPLLLLLIFNYSSMHLNYAFADLKQDQIKGSVKLTMVPDEPQKPVNPVNPVNPDNPNNPDNGNWNNGGNANSNANNERAVYNPHSNNPVYKTVKDFLAKTGDAQVVLIVVTSLIALSCLTVLILINRKVCRTDAGGISEARIVHLKRIFVLCTALSLIIGSAFIINRAIADDKKEGEGTSDKTEIASLDANISVQPDGTVKSATLHLKNNLKTSLHFNKITSESSSILSELLNSGFSTDEIIKPNTTFDKTWNFENKKLSADLVSKLKEEKTGALTYDIVSDIAYNMVKIEFVFNDGTDKVFYTEEVIEGNNAKLPENLPQFSSRKFVSWNIEAKGAGTLVDADYLLKNGISANIKFYARWTGPEVFLAKKSEDKEMPCKVFSGEDTKTELKTIDEVKKVAETLKDGIESPDNTIYNATNDEWHLFAKISGNGDKINDWLECRIIHVGRHDSEENGITFQATHALPKRVAYDSTFTGNDANIIDYTGNWSTSTVRKYLNNTFKASLPASLQNKLASVSKLSNKKAGEKPVAGKEPVMTTDKLWVISYTELIRNASTKVDETWGKGSDSHDGSTYKFWYEKDLVVGSGVSNDSEQAKYFLAFNSDRAGKLLTFRQRNDYGFCMLRSVSPHYASFSMDFGSDGFLYNVTGTFPNDTLSVAPAFSL